MRRSLALCSLALIGLALPASRVAAQPRPEGDVDSATRIAQKHFERGERMFSLGRFEEALEAYQSAFEARPLPEFLFNIGQCYRNLGDYRSAIFSFRKYLKLVPDAPNRRSVEATIAKLETELERSDRDGTDPLVPDPDRRRRRDDGGDQPIYSHWGFWAGVVVVAAGATAGTYYLTRDGGVPMSDLGNLDFGK